MIMGIGLIAEAQQQSTTKKIQILNANSLIYNEQIHPNARILIGDVELEHNDFIMFQFHIAYQDSCIGMNLFIIYQGIGI